MENIPSLARKILGTALSLTQETPIMKRTVKEYLWGYEDPLLSGLKAILPDLVPNDQISIFAAAVIDRSYPLFHLPYLHHRSTKPNTKPF